MNREGTVHGVDPEASVAENAPLIISARVQELLQWEPYLKDPMRVMELHQMRIAAKRLRYTLELFGPALGGALPPAIERIKVLQDLLGDIHDLDVVTPLLVGVARQVLRSGRKVATWQDTDFNGALGLLSLCRKKHAARRALHARLRAEWRKLRKDGLLDAVAGGGPSPQPEEGETHAVVS